MELSNAIGSMAVVLGVMVAAGFAAGEDNASAPQAKTVSSKKNLEDYQKRREHFERACNKPLKTDLERETCRAAYRAL